MQPLSAEADARRQVAEHRRSRLSHLLPSHLLPSCARGRSVSSAPAALPLPRAFLLVHFWALFLQTRSQSFSLHPSSLHRALDVTMLSIGDAGQCRYRRFPAAWHSVLTVIQKCHVLTRSEGRGLRKRFGSPQHLHGDAVA